MLKGIVSILIGVQSTDRLNNKANNTYLLSISFASLEFLDPLPRPILY